MKTKILIIILSVLLLCLIFYYRNIGDFRDSIIDNNMNMSNSDFGKSCIVEDKVIVHGDSMSPLIKDNASLTLLKKFYNCGYNVDRGDIIVYNKRDSNNLIKEVRAIPGDSFEYENNNIIINGKILKNSEDKKYNIESKILELYAKNYKIIPQGAYLIFGDQENGSNDSSKFGFVSKNDFVGKIKFR